MSRRHVTIALFTVAVSIATLCVSLPAYAAKLSVPQRIERLTKDIDAARTADELTGEQQMNLRDELKAVSEKVQKIKEKNNGNLPEQDSRKLHRTLNDISVKTFQLRLENIYG
jgi:hypothetical protein